MKESAAERGQDLMELEHVIGFTGRYRGALHCHPVHPFLVYGMGANVVIQSIDDAHQQSFLSGHSNEVSAIDVSKSTGALVASGQVGTSALASKEAVVIVWDFAHRAEVYQLAGITDAVIALSFSHDETFLAASGQDGSLIIWDMHRGERVASKVEPDVVTTFAWCQTDGSRETSSKRPEYVLFACMGHEMLAYHLRYCVGSMQYVMTTERMRMPTGLKRQYLSSAVTFDSSRLFVTTNVGDVNEYRVENQTYSCSFPVCNGGANCIFTDEQGLLFVGGGDATLKCLVRQAGTWGLVDEVTLEGAVTSIAQCQSRNLLFVGTDVGKIYHVLEEKGRLRLLKMTQSETSEVVAAAFNPESSERFATLSRGGDVRVWDLSDYSVVTHVRERSSPQTPSFGSCLVFDSEENCLMTGWTSGQVRAYAASAKVGGNKIWEIAMAHRDGVASIAATSLYIATGNHLICVWDKLKPRAGGCNGGVRLWSRRSRSQLFEFPDHIMKPVTRLLPDVRLSHLLHSCSLDSSIYTYDLKQEKRVVHHQLNGGPSFISMSQRVESDNELITAGLDGRLLFWDHDVKDPVHEIREKSGHSFTWVDVSPRTGGFLAATSSQGSLTIWDLQSCKLIASAYGHSSHPNCVVWSPDEKQLVTVGNDKCICVWNFYGCSLEEKC